MSNNHVRAADCPQDQYSLWESAYRRFETPEEETLKFIKRLLKLGSRDWPKDFDIVELFCGHGNGLEALSRLGFTSLEGVDLSAGLINEYSGSARCYVADCRALPFSDHSRDIAIIQGGLHHLEKIPEDLYQTLDEIRRILRKNGLLILVEPWLTPFLFIVHEVCNFRLARRFSKKIDALATMIELEQPVYGNRLEHPKEILALVERFFEPQKHEIAWGKLLFVGRVRPRF